jgi:hypothetical protein
MRAMANDYVMFLLYKLPEVFTECHFHLLRYMATRDQERKEQLTYLIYTDQPSLFDRWKNTDLNLEVVPTPFERIQSWYGPRQFLWRAKIMAIRDALQRTGGNVLYCDTDTYPRQDLGALFRRLDAGELFMYENEGYIDKAAYPHFHMYHIRFAEHPTLRVGSRIYEIPLTTPIWNAGVIGIGHTQAPIIDEVLAFCDALYEEWPFVAVEQFSMGYIFENSSNGCTAAKDFLYHYWAVRRYALLLDRLFEFYGSRDLDRLIRASERILAEDLAPIKEAWDQSRPFQFLWRNYPYGRYIISRIYTRQWPIEKQFSRLDLVD